MASSNSFSVWRVGRRACSAGSRRRRPRRRNRRASWSRRRAHRCPDACAGTAKAAASATWRQPGCRADHQNPAVVCAIELRDRIAQAFKAGVQARIEEPAGLGQFDRSRAPMEQRTQSCSRPRIWWLSAAGVTCSSSAALAKLRCRAIASKARNALSGGRGRGPMNIPHASDQIISFVTVPF